MQNSPSQSSSGVAASKKRAGARAEAGRGGGGAKHRDENVAAPQGVDGRGDRDGPAPASSTSPRRRPRAAPPPTMDQPGGFAYKQVVRKKDERAKLRGHTCEQCEAYVEGLINQGMITREEREQVGWVDGLGGGGLRSSTDACVTPST